MISYFGSLWVAIVVIWFVASTLKYKLVKCEKDYELVSTAIVGYENPNYSWGDQVICITDKSLIEWKVEKQTNDLLFVNSGTGERMQKHSCQKVDTFNYNQ